jgi:hypothetical protein
MLLVEAGLFTSKRNKNNKREKSVSQRHHVSLNDEKIVRATVISHHIRERALDAQEWECSPDKAESVRTSPNKLSTPVKLSRAFSYRLYLKVSLQVRKHTGSVQRGFCK